MLTFQVWTVACLALVVSVSGFGSPGTDSPTTDATLSPTMDKTPAPTMTTPAPIDATPSPTMDKTPAPTMDETPAPTMDETPAPTMKDTPSPTPAPTEDLVCTQACTDCPDGTTVCPDANCALAPCPASLSPPTPEPIYNLPTYAPGSDYIAVTWNDYTRGTESLCDPEDEADMLAVDQDCFLNPTNGIHYRYACTEDDTTKVYTDTCNDKGCRDTDCEDDWSWEGERANVCYDDGDVLFEYDCLASDEDDSPFSGISDLVVDQNVVPTESAASTGQLNCVELGWDLGFGDSMVCGNSEIDVTANDGCSGAVDYSTAEALCLAANARLCTSLEVSNDEVKKTGCGYDCERVWSSSGCEDGGIWTQAGARKCRLKEPVKCSSKSETHNVRCCSDSVIRQTISESDDVDLDSEGYPEGYAVAISYEFDAEDGNCGLSEPLSEYSCWTDPITGTSIRFACKSEDPTIWVQTCGTDSTCDSSSCDGAWYTDLEMIGSCYEGDGVFYHYKCPM